MQQPNYMVGVVLMSIACLVLIVLSIRQFVASKPGYRSSWWLLLLWAGYCALAAWGDYASAFDEPEHQSRLTQKLAFAAIIALLGLITTTILVRNKAKKPIP